MDLLNYIKCLNRKERYYVMKNAVSDMNVLKSDFKIGLERAIGISIPKRGIYVAIDYHLDFLATALYLYRMNAKLNKNKGSFIVKSSIKTLESVFPNCAMGGLMDEHAINTGKQDDSDIIIVFKRDDDYHIILVEAKCDTKWNQKQLIYKMERITILYNFIKDNDLNVKLYFTTYSPKMLDKFDFTTRYSFPSFLLGAKYDDNTLRPAWFEMEIKHPLFKATRQDGFKSSPQKSKDDLYRNFKVEKV